MSDTTPGDASTEVAPTLLQSVKLLMSHDNPAGWNLHALLEQLIAEVIEKSAQLVGDTRQIAQDVLANNHGVIDHLMHALEHQKATVAALEAFVAGEVHTPAAPTEPLPDEAVAETAAPAAAPAEVAPPAPEGVTP